LKRKGIAYTAKDCIFQYRNRFLLSLISHTTLSHLVTMLEPQPAPVWASHRVTASVGHPPAPPWGPLWAAGGYLLHYGPPWAAEGQPTSPWSSSWAAGESLLWLLEHLLPLLLHRSWCLQSCFSHIHTPLSHCSFLPLLKYIITEVLPPLLMGSALASRGYILELAGIGSVRHSGSFWQLLTDTTPVYPLLPTPCKPSTQA